MQLGDKHRPDHGGGFQSQHDQGQEHKDWRACCDAKQPDKNMGNPHGLNGSLYGKSSAHGGL